MIQLLHVSTVPRGAESESLRAQAVAWAQAPTLRSTARLEASHAGRRF